jgi:hypothetical protein
MSNEQVCARCILPSSFPRIEFDEKKVCSVCRDYDHWWSEWNSRKSERRKTLEKICRQAKNKYKEFDALVPLSGGKDSTYVLYLAKKVLGLNCLAYTLDNGYLSDYAKHNIETTCRKLQVEHLYYCLDPELTNRLFALFMKKTGWFCSVCMRAIAMAHFRLADLYKTPLIITGSSMRTEPPLTREMFQSGDPAHFQSVLAGEPIARECKRLCQRGASTKRKLGYAFFLASGQKRLYTYAIFNIADYVDWNYQTIYNTIREELSWEAPVESEHMDCIIHPIQKYIHNRRFPNLNMTKLTLARLVMDGQITREEALRRLENEQNEQCPNSIMKLFLKNLIMTKEEFDKYVDMGPRHLQYHPQVGLALRIARKLFPTSISGRY